jgi:hypothetical protein
MAHDERRLQPLQRGPPAIACPTGALIINEFSNVDVENDICSG